MLSSAAASGSPAGSGSSGCGSTGASFASPTGSPQIASSGRAAGSGSPQGSSSPKTPGTSRITSSHAPVFSSIINSHPCGSSPSRQGFYSQIQSFFRRKGAFFFDFYLVFKNYHQLLFICRHRLFLNRRRRYHRRFCYKSISKRGSSGSRLSLRPAHRLPRGVFPFRETAPGASPVQRGQSILAAISASPFLPLLHK